MPRAVLEIDATTAGIVAAFGQIRTQAQETERVVRASMGNLFAGIPAGSRRAQQSVYRDTQQITRDQERAAQASVRAFVRAEEQKRRAAQLTAEGRARAERQASEIARTEAQRRGLTAEQEARVRTTALERVTRAVEREERQQTAVASREAARRERDARTIGHGFRRGMNVGRDAAMNVAREQHSQIQDARRQRAEADRQLGRAVLSSGGTVADMTRTRDVVRAFSTASGMNYGEVVTALEYGQARGAGLERQAGETPQQALQRALALVEEGRAVGADPGQYLAAYGRLRSAGLSGDSLRTALRFSAQAAEAGSVEVDQIIQQGLPGATRLMETRASALGPRATPQQIQAARLRAFQESVAVQEVAASAGGTPRQISNAFAGLENFMRVPRRQQAMLTNIQNEVQRVNASTPEGRERRERLRALYTGANAIFEQDPTRRDPNGGRVMRLRSGITAMDMAARVSQATGGDARAAANIFAGGGHGNPQSLLTNMQDIFALLGNQGRGQQIARMLQGSGLSQEEINQRQSAIKQDELSRMTTAEQEGINALTDNTNKLKQLSDAIADFSARNPLTSSITQGFGGLLAGGVGGALINRAGQYFAGNGLAARAFQFLSGTGGEAAVAGEAAGAGEVAATVGSGARFLAGRANPVAAFLTTMLTPSNFRQAAYDDRALIAAHRGAGGGGAGRTAAAMALNRPPSAQEIGNAVAESLRQAPLTAVVSPVDATHAATTAAPRR